MAKQTWTQQRCPPCMHTRSAAQASAAAGAMPGQRGPWCAFRAGHCVKHGAASASSSSSAGGVRPKLNCGPEHMDA